MYATCIIERKRRRRTPVLSLVVLAARDIFGNFRRFLSFTAIFFITFLIITVASSMFAGLCKHMVGISYAAAAPVWVHPQSTYGVDINLPLPDEVLDKIRSVEGVAIAEPFCVTRSTVRLPNGCIFRAQVVGVPDETLAGLPDSASFDPREFARPRTVLVNTDYYDTVFRDGNDGHLFLNDFNFDVCGVTKVFPLVDSEMILYMKRSDYLVYLYQTLRSTSFILVWPEAGHTGAEICGRINSRFPELTAQPQKEFCLSTIGWYLRHVSLAQSFMLLVILVMFFSMTIIMQNLSAYIAENRAALCTLKILGFSNLDLAAMILVEIVICLFFAVAFGIGVCAVFFWVMSIFPTMFFYLLPEIIFVGGGAVGMTAVFSCLMTLRKFTKIEPADAFKT